MKKGILFIFTLMLAIFFVACNDTATTDKTTVKDSTGNDAANVEEFIKNEGSKFDEEMKRGDSNALAAHYASDAIVMPPNSDRVKGKDIVGLWGGAIRMGVKGMTLNMADISGGGDVYTETGTFEMTGVDNKTIDKGNYVTVWKKDNGNWKIYRDIWNSSMAMQASK
jgi:ketosteroid isomerase-like protein